MEIEIGSLWKHKECSAEAEVVQINLDERRCIIVGFRYVKNSSGGGSKTKSNFLDMFEPKSDFNKGFSDKEGIDESAKRQEFNKGFDKGSEYGKSILRQEQQNQVERERALQEEAWEQGFLAAIQEMTECDCPEEYSEYEFGAVGEESDYSGQWVSKYNLEKVIEYHSDCGSYLYMKVISLPKIQSGLYVGDLITVYKNHLDRDYDKIVPNPEHSSVDSMRRMLKDWSESIDIETFSKQMSEIEIKSSRKHSHYFKDVRHLDYVDVYMVCKLFEVDDSSHCTQHAIKKLLMSGKRGVKGKVKDITEARDTLNRYLQIIEESGESE